MPMQCAHAYRNSQKQCPHEAEGDSSLCRWHAKRDDKSFDGEDLTGYDLEEAYLSGASLKGAVLREAVLDDALLDGAVLENADMSGASGHNASFLHAQMRGVKAVGARLKHARFEEAILANCDFDRADLSWGSFKKALLPGTTLRQATLLDATFEDATLLRASLEKATLRGAVMDRADLQIADLRGADLRGATMREANLRGADLRGADLKYAVLEETVLSNANLQKADLARSQLGGTLAQSANLKGTNLREADLHDVNFAQANLERANLRGAMLNGANFDNALLNDTDLFNAKIEEVRNLRYATMKSTQITEHLADTDRAAGNHVSALKRYDEAIATYIALKNHFNKEGLYDKSGEFYIMEWKTKAKLQSTATHLESEQLRANRFVPYYLPHAYTHVESRFFPLILKGEAVMKLAFNRGLYYFSKYGESPFRVLATSLLIMGVYALIFWTTGAITRGEPVYAPTFMESLYFSVVTFTTLGYGDYHPKSAYQTLAVSEALIGAFILAFFVVVVSRRLVR